jgi:hypothetical protein
MNGIRNLAGAAAAAALLTACGSGPPGSHAAAPAAATHSPAAAGATRSPSQAAHSRAATPAAGSPSAAPAPAGRLTMRRAKLAYVRITGPGTALASKLGNAASGIAPYSQFRADALAYTNELRAEIGKLGAVRWPAGVQSRITALITTTLPSDIRCLQAVAAAGSMTASQAVSSNNKDCQIADNSPIPTSL